MQKSNNNQKLQTKVINLKKKKVTKNKRKANKAVRDAVFESEYDKSVVIRGPPRTGKNPMMSACALKYAMSIARPFSVEALGACIPSIPAQDTHKVAGFVRGDGVIGTAGVGWIAITPCVANDVPTIFYSTAAYTSASVIPLTLGVLNTGVATLAVNNLPYASQLLAVQAANDNQGLRGRVVSCGLSIQYTGTALNESGMVYLTRDPNHNNVLFAPAATTPIGIGNLGSYAYTELCPFTREKCFVADFASRYDELNFSETTSGASATQTTTLSCYPYTSSTPSFPTSGGASSVYTVTTPNGNSVNVGSATVVVMVTGVAGQSFHFEYTVHSEFVGTLAQASLTPSDSDEKGAGEVMVAANQVGMRKVANPRASYWDLLYEGLSYAAKRAAPIVIPALEKAAIAMLA